MLRLTGSLHWAEHIVRWKQTAEVGYLPNEKMPNTFLGVTIDIFGRRGDPHEKAKQHVAKRLIPGIYKVFISYQCYPY